MATGSDPNSPPDAAGVSSPPRRRFGVGNSVLLVIAAAASAVIYFGLVARGPLWPMYDLLATAAPLLLLAVVSAADWLAYRLRR